MRRCYVAKRRVRQQTSYIDKDGSGTAIHSHLQGSLLKLLSSSLPRYWIVTVRPAGDDGKAVDPNLYAPASQLPLSGRNAPTLSLESGAKLPALMLSKFAAALIATEPDNNCPKLLALIFDAVTNFDVESQ